MTVIYKTVEVEVEVELDDDDIADIEREIEEKDVCERERDFKLDLYRAIYAGDIDEAFDLMRMMAMIDIDRDVIWAAMR